MKDYEEFEKIHTDEKFYLYDGVRDNTHFKVEKAWDGEPTYTFVTRALMSNGKYEIIEYQKPWDMASMALKKHEGKLIKTMSLDKKAVCLNLAYMIKAEPFVLVEHHAVVKSQGCEENRQRFRFLIPYEGKREVNFIG